ncbi:MAG: ATP-dependent DNA helicase RecG [Ruminococcaceae bacterium]|nr:ATP-dependent DNA helicase RecG [Oscillospiraceae bacterium]
MSYIDTDIKKLYGVGEAHAKAYANLGITTVSDLLSHYPRGYEDRGDIKLLSEIDDFEKHAFILTVATQPKTARIKGKMSVTKFRAYDDSAQCEIVFFNQDYIKNVFTVGEIFRFYGKLDKSSRGMILSSPVYEPYSEDKNLPSLIPVYSATGKISQKQIAKDVRSALVLAACDRESIDPLPEDIRIKHKLCMRSFAQKNIHFPESFASLAASKKRIVFDELFTFALGISLVGAQGKRSEAYPCENTDINPLLKLLPYSLTSAQARVIADIQSDMKKNTAMSRIVIGDVGCGKTVCAAAAMLFAVQSGHQAALLAPTEILARQHYISLCDIFAELGIKCELLLGATTAAEKRRIYASLKDDSENRTDIVIGTHAILSEGVEFSSLALSVIDEQHRFGVGQRSSLARKNPLSHTLVMSATPIPRSLALALYGELDISAIDEIPAGRQAVDTFVVDESYRARLNGFIRKQVESGGQVYVVCPAVEESEDSESNVLIEQVGVGGDLLDSGERIKLKSAIAFSEELAQEFPDLKVDFLHGKLKPREKEEKMAHFVAGKTDILVSTTVIEVGVNVPNASLMIVENAERFGLSQLHQLRGRVGRGARKAYCVFVSDAIKKNGNARERLMTVKNSHDGYHIAEKDLAMRGPGDFLARRGDSYFRQSGGVRFRLAELCEDTGLLTVAFAEAKSLIQKDPELSSYPLLRREVERLFSFDDTVVN